VLLDIAELPAREVIDNMNLSAPGDQGIE